MFYLIFDLCFAYKRIHIKAYLMETFARYHNEFFLCYYALCIIMLYFYVYSTPLHKFYNQHRKEIFAKDSSYPKQIKWLENIKLTFVSLFMACFYVVLIAFIWGSNDKTSKFYLFYKYRDTALLFGFIFYLCYTYIHIIVIEKLYEYKMKNDKNLS